MKVNAEKYLKKENIIILIAHPSDETLFFYEGIKKLSENYVIDVLCLTYSSTSIRGKELIKAMSELNVSVLFKNMGDKGINSLLYNIEKCVTSELRIKKYAILITYPPHGGEKSHPYHIQCFHIARRLSHKMHLRFGFFSEKKINFNQQKSNAYNFSFFINLRYFFNYVCLYIKIRKFPLKNFIEVRNEFQYLIQNIFRSPAYFLFYFYPKIFEKQSMLGLYMSQINSLIKFKTYLNSIEYLYLEPSSPQIKNYENLKTTSNL